MLRGRAARVIIGMLGLLGAAIVIYALVHGGGQPGLSNSPVERARTVDSDSGRHKATAPGTSAGLAASESQARQPSPLYGRLVGQRIMAPLTGASPTASLLRQVRTGRVGGVIVFPNGVPASDVGNAIRTLQRAATSAGQPPLLVATDQEGGAIKRFAQGPPDTPPPLMNNPIRARREGLATGRYLAQFGINMDLAPVLDVSPPSGESFIGSQGRTFSPNADTVAQIGTAFAEGLSDSGVAATAKHFPGLGHATVDTDQAHSVIAAYARDDLVPFRTAIDDGIPAVMVSTATYPSYDSRDPAAWSRPIIRHLLREELRFSGVVITDDLSSAGVRSVSSTPRAALRSAKAGADIILIATEASTVRPTYGRLYQAARTGSLPFTSLLASYHRITELKRELIPTGAAG